MQLATLPTRSISLSHSLSHSAQRNRRHICTYYAATYRALGGLTQSHAAAVAAAAGPWAARVERMSMSIYVIVVVR